MNWHKSVQLGTRLPKVIRAITKGLLQQNADKVPLFKKAIIKGRGFQRNAGKIPLMFNKAAGLAKGDIALGENLVSDQRKLYWRSSYGSAASSCWSRKDFVNLPRKFEHNGGSNLGRDFLAQLRVAYAKTKKTTLEERKQQVFVRKDETVLGSKDRYFCAAPTNGPYGFGQSATEPLESASREEAWTASVLSISSLLITRDIEWANIILCFQQENRYAIRDASYPRAQPVGFIHEQSNVVFRQLLRSRRPFVATISNAIDDEVFRVRRPFWWITGSTYVELGGKEIGVVHRRWHLWRRIYDLYLGDEQFATVENPGPWNWTFTLKGINGEVLAEIERDCRGFGLEVFTDAGQYVIRFDRHNMPGHLFKVARPLTLLERAVTVALAVSLDNDYFSRCGAWALQLLKEA